MRLLRALIVEDSPDDADLLLLALRRGGVEVEATRVDTVDGLAAALRDGTWDLVLADYRLPGFSALTALRMIRASGLDVPVFVVSGSVTVEQGVETMLAGAHDYLEKDSLTRLVPAIARELEVRDQRRRAQEALRLLEVAVETIRVGVTITDTTGRIVFANPAEAEMHGYEVAELVGKDVRVFSPNRLWNPMSKERMREAGKLAAESVNVDRAGRAIPVQLVSNVVKDGSGDPIAVVTVSEDISERKALEERLRRSAFHDPLTGLANRTLLLDRLNGAINRLKRRERYLFAVLFLDLDRFKRVNDSLGHSIGDQLLIAIAQRLEGCLRPEDTIARLGGDEFAILLDSIHDQDDATSAADRILHVLANPFAVDGHEVFSSASVGIVVSSGESRSAEDYLRDADIAMYRAKSNGKARHEVYHPSLHAQSRTLLQLEMDLRRAVEREELQLHYQPIVSLSSGRVGSVEALMRWRHPRNGLLGPESFISLAEETGLISSLGLWGLEEACRQVLQWDEHRTCPKGMSVGVNLSPKQFAQGDLVDRIEEILTRMRFDPARLNIEITESAVMENADTVTRKLMRMRDMGLRVQIDDFGTGYSSLSYLQRLPIDALKIDRSFVHQMNFREESVEIVRTIVQLAHGLGLRVLAEGVETGASVRRLQELGCDGAQGYWFARPLDGEEAGLLLRTDPCWEPGPSTLGPSAP